MTYCPSQDWDAYSAQEEAAAFEQFLSDLARKEYWDSYTDDTKYGFQVGAEVMYEKIENIINSLDRKKEFQPHEILYEIEELDPRW